MTARERVGNPRELVDVGPQLPRPQGAVQPDGEGSRVSHRVPERLGRLARQRAPAEIGDGARYHHGQTHATFLEELIDGEQRRLGIEGVEHRLDHEQVDAAVDQPAHCLGVGDPQLVEGDVAAGRILDVRGNRRRAVGGSQHPGHPSRTLGRAFGHRVGGTTGDARRRQVELVGGMRERVVRLSDGRGVERIGLDDVGARIEVGRVDGAHDVGLRQAQHVIVAAQLARMIGEAIPTIVRLGKAKRLDHGAHRTVEHHDALAQRARKRLSARVAPAHRATSAAPPSALGGAAVPMPRMRQIAAVSSARLSV